MLYPDIETFRRDSESLDAVEDFRHYQMERNYNHLFAKGPALTKDFLEKMNTDIVPKKTYLFGYELNTKKILFICGLFLLFFTSLFGVVVMWFTEFFDNTVLSTMVISNSSKYFKMWTNPTPKGLVSIHIFNYTNLDEFNNGFEKKLRVQEVGPYVYDESMERVNVEFSDDGSTVSYQEKRFFRFRPDLSKGRQSDQVNVPSMPVMTAVSMSKYHNYFARLGLSSFLNGIDEKAFITLPADKLAIGYKNRILDIYKSLSLFSGTETIPETAGLLSSRIGVQPHVITMNTGKNDISRLGVIEKFNGKERFDYWSTDECNSVQAGDGAVYPPKLVQGKQPLHFLFPQVCRTLPLIFEREVNILDGKIPAFRYVPPDDIFASAEEKPENQCYCNIDSGVCPLKGVYNVTPCNYGVPLFISNPHFYGGDEVLLKGVDGLRTLEKNDIETYINVHPTMGFAMSAKAMFQLNIQVQKAYGVSQLEKLEDGTMLPMAWTQVELNERTLPQEFVNLIYDSTYTLKGVKLAFQYGFLLTTLITLICIVLFLRTTWEKPIRLGVHPRNTERSVQENGMEI